MYLLADEAALVSQDLLWQKYSQMKLRQQLGARDALLEELAREIQGRVEILVLRANYWHSVLRIRRLSAVSRFHPHQLRHHADIRIMPGSGCLV